VDTGDVHNASVHVSSATASYRSSTSIRENWKLIALLGPIVHVQSMSMEYKASVPWDIVPEFADVLTMPPVQHVLIALVDRQVGIGVLRYSPGVYAQPPPSVRVKPASQ
jgi:hypothetical protein